MDTAGKVLDSLSEETMLPDLLQAAPQVRPVLDRYGLRGCGGEHGPMESLAFFARAHGVPLQQLMGEIRANLEQGNQAEQTVQAETDPVADAIYQPFFKAGIAVALTLGAVWGAFLLIRIALSGSFTAVGIHEVNAHGHAQIFGWVGLFVMGFAYQAFPRFKHTSLAHPRVALTTLWLLLTGIVIRSTSQALLPYAPWTAGAGVAGSVLEIVAIGLFIGIIWKTLRSTGQPFAFYEYYILCALGWFFTQAVYETVYFAATAAAPDRDALLGLVSTWQAPLRDIQIHGFALLIILGVSLRMFHNLYGFTEPNRRTSIAALVLLNAAVIGESVGFVLMRTLGHAWTTLWYGSVIVLAATVAALVWGWHIYRPAPEPNRSLKYLRTAYGWLFLSLAMLVALPLYQFGLLRAFAPDSEAAQIGFSHAYYGAIRHAITVGFVSLMIVGVAARIVPTLKGIDSNGLNRLWLPFVLINTGCAMRVGFQTLTDFTNIAFPITGVSGILEVSGLTVWGIHLWGIMNGRIQEISPKRATLGAGQPITAQSIVADVLRIYPETLETFLAFGFKPLANPVLRRTMAATVTVERAAGMHGADLALLLTALNAIRQRARADASLHSSSLTTDPA
ncbi:MAG: DUF1858 domain-containing protein [Candidatus Hydrogenedentes bacterium]|nr:DUF1858 domain-containing protein [Candidatus Hydrogenedentota bacterium]